MEQTNSQKAEVLQKFFSSISKEQRKIVRCENTQRALKKLLEDPRVHEQNSNMSTVHEQIIFKAISELEEQRVEGFEKLGGVISELFALTGFGEQFFKAIMAEKHEDKLKQLCDIVLMGTQMVKENLAKDAKRARPAKIINLFGEEI